MRKNGIKRRQCEGGRNGRTKHSRVPNAKQMPSLHLSARALRGAEQGFCFVLHRNSDDCACLGVCFFGELLSFSEFKGSKTTLIGGSDWCWPGPIERVWLDVIKTRNSPKRQRRKSGSGGRREERRDAVDFNF